MQELLSFTVNAIIVISIAYFSIGFVLGAVARSARPVPPTAAELTADFQQIVAASESTIDIVVVPDSCPALPLPPQAPTKTAPKPLAKPIAPTTAELRKQCSQNNIIWRNAHGKNKHLSAQEMRKELASVT